MGPDVPTVVIEKTDRSGFTTEQRSTGGKNGAGKPKTYASQYLKDLRWVYKNPTGQTDDAARLKLQAEYAADYDKFIERLREEEEKHQKLKPQMKKADAAATVALAKAASSKPQAEDGDQAAAVERDRGAEFLEEQLEAWTAEVIEEANAILPGNTGTKPYRKDGRAADGKPVPNGSA